MEVQGTLAVLAEIAIAIAGFSGVVAALSSRAQSEWTRIDNIRLAMLLEISLTAAFFCLLPLVLLSTRLDAATVWRIASASWLIFLAARLPFTMRRLQSVRPLPSDVSRLLLIVFLAGLVLAFALQVTNAIALSLPWPHLSAQFWGLVVAALFFVRLVRGLWRGRGQAV